MARADGQLAGDRPRTPAEENFLGGLASRISGWSLPDITFASFSVIARMKPIVVTLNVPGIDVPAGTCTLQVGYWHDGPHARALEGEWGDSHLLDNHVYDRDGLSVFGLDETPETYGTFAAGWLQRQLQQPVERLDWLRGERIRESAWRLAESGKTIARVGWSVRRPGRGPDRILRVR
jgi:hypothetical protein